MEKNSIRVHLNDLFEKLGFLDEIQSDCCHLTLSQCHTLLAVGRKGNLSVNELADDMNLNKSTASRHITQLAEKLLVERVESLDDRRFLELKLSDEGQRQFQLIEDTMENYYSKILQNIPPEKQEQILDSLKTLLLAINACC